MTDRREFLKGAGAVAVAGTLTGCGVDRMPDKDVPRSSFDEDSTAEEVTTGIDLDGKLAVVTGCTSGIGYETLRVLALRGAHVVGTSRSLERAREACSRVAGIATPLQLDLADLDSVVASANAIRALDAAPDILVLNAGYLGERGKRELVNGVEKHFAINHLGHFVFVNHLLDRLYLADQGRIVVVSSRAAYSSAPEEGILFDDLAANRDYSNRRAYGQSKLANALFALQLARKLEGSRVTANALHPGLINTEIDRNLGWVTQKVFALYAAVGGTKSVEQGAATSCFVATSPSLDSTSGKYFEDCNAVIIGEGHLHDEQMAQRLWDVSQELTDDYLVTHTDPDGKQSEQSLTGASSDHVG